MLALGLLALGSAAPAQSLTLFDGRTVAGIVHDQDRPLALAGAMLANDLFHVTGAKPRLSTNLEDCAALCIVIGRKGSPLIDAVARDSGLDLAALDGQWERYARTALRSRSHPSRRYLVIAGSDMRGAIWGTVDLTREIGVSAWEWWADVTPRKVTRLTIDGNYRLSPSPSVQYRGIFLNDEDWGLQPWAARTFEPETGDIGPRTYTRIFELMWRLKANLIWPAMHDSTKPFYQIAGNAEAARDHAIIVGTSHAEPMMRNNVREWDEKADGAFNFFTNREAMIRYWRERVQAVAPFENIYSVGLRGKHDSEMEGAPTPEAARDARAEVITLQRSLLSQAQRKRADQIPQALTLYKEVLDLYGLGLKVPDDIMLVWPEDNYGYISQLPNAQERARSGGSGVYYHISYWGRPHDYLWLATTHPALIREQMDRAREMGANRLWVVNVGDIKPGEYLTQYFLDLAFDAAQFTPTPRDHLNRWTAVQFGPALADEAAAILTDYYDLAFERRPEFMGFSQTEPTRPIAISDYIRSGGAEAWPRIDRYAALTARAEALAERIPTDRRDAYFQLILYPVRAAASINERNLKLDLAALYTRQGRPVANRLSDEARSAHARIVADTAAYNAQNGGKWRGIMDMAPRRLPVFAEPAYPKADFPVKPGCAIDASELRFVEGRKASHALTIYSWGEPQSWSLTGLTPLSGQLNADNGFQQRVMIRYDGKTALKAGTVQCGGKTMTVPVQFGKISSPIDRIISLTAADAGPNADWEHIDGLGSRGMTLRSKLTLASRSDPAQAMPLDYSFDLPEKTDAELRVIALPAHPLTSANRLRIAIQIDGQAAQMLDFQTFGRSEEWKQNVLRNHAERSIPLPQLAPGQHRLRVYALDPGFLLDRLDVRLDGAPDLYGAPSIE